MKNKVKKFILIGMLLTATGCGYKVIDDSAINKLNIKEINSSGNKRINFKIKNSLMVEINNSINKENNLIIAINTEKSKKIKEKNINNEVTKYKISITSDVMLNFLEKNEQQKFKVTSTGDFMVGEKYSSTLSNEKRLVESLSDDLSIQIKNKSTIIFNDL